MENLNPWGNSQVKDYEKMRREFGIDPMFTVLKGNLMSERNLLMGQRDFHKVESAMNEKKKFAAMTGLMPSGQMHLGSKAVIDQMIYFQSKGAQVHIAVADLESFVTRGISLEKGREIAIENFLLNYIAMGLKPCNFYFQSDNFRVQKLAFIVSKEVTLSEMRSIYGFVDSKRMLELNAPLVQVADILGPQVYDEPMPTIVPVGADQDPHIRLTRDISGRMNIMKITRKKDGFQFSVGGQENVKEYFQIIKRIIKKYGLKVIKENPAYRTIDTTGDDVNIDSIELDLAGGERIVNAYSTISPSSIILRLETGLQGGKMSKSIPESTVSLNDEPGDVEKKIKKAFTGGRESIEEQRKLGANPYICPVFELYMYHLSENDKHLREVEDTCKNGSRLCGSCKLEAADLMRTYLVELKEKRESSRHLVPAYLGNENGMQ